MPDTVKSHMPTFAAPNPSDGPPSVRHGVNPPVIDEVSVRYHDLRGKGHSDEDVRKALAIEPGHPIETPDLIAGKRAAQARLAADAAKADADNAAKVKAAEALFTKLMPAFSSLTLEESRLFDAQIAHDAHGNPAALGNLRSRLGGYGLRTV